MKAPALQLCTHLAAIALTIASLPVLTLAQVPAAAIIPGTAPTYAEEPVVIEHADSIFNMLADGTGWRQLTLTARLQSDAALKKYGVLSVAYASSSEHVEIKYTRVRHPDGTVSETQASDAMDMPSAVTRAAPFYSDQKELQLPIRSLRVGDTLEFQYRIVRTKAEAPGHFWGRELFTEASVVLSQTVELRVPTGMYVNVWSPNLKPVESNTDAITGTPAQHIYRWAYSQLKPTAGKDAEAAAAAKNKILWSADQELDLEQGRLPTIAWTTFKSWGRRRRLVARSARNRPHRSGRHHQGQGRRTHHRQIHRRSQGAGTLYLRRHQHSLYRGRVRHRPLSAPHCRGDPQQSVRRLQG